MSPSSDFSAFILQAENELAGRFIFYSALVLLLWDSICTFEQEVDIVWKTKLSLGAWLYLFTRYGTLLCLFIQFMPPPIEHTRVTCFVVQTVTSWTTILITLGYHGLLTLRTYAISGRKLYILVPLLGIYVGRFIEQVISFATVISFCEDFTLQLLSDNAKELIANDVLDLTAEVIAFLVAVYVTYENWRFFRKRKAGGKVTDKNLSVIIFEQGAIAFGLIIAIPVISRVLVKMFPERAAIINAAQPLSLTFPILISCRFFLSLRQRNLPRMSRYSTRISRTVSRMQFGTITSLSPESTSQSRRTISFPPLHIQALIETEFGEAELSPTAEMRQRDSSIPIITREVIQEEV